MAVKKERLVIEYEHFACAEELSREDETLVRKAQEALESSYSPYSHFRVGAAIRTQDGNVILGANQENAAYPSGLCAERTALFSCGMQGSKPETLAIVARDEKGNSASPYPCGACRQVMSETETRYGAKLSVIVSQKDGSYVKFSSASSLLPFEFEL